MSNDCGTCAFFVSGPNGHEIGQPVTGECRRYPPTVHVVQQGRVSMFPNTTDTNYCGEHQVAILVRA